MDFIVFKFQMANDHKMINESSMPYKLVPFNLIKIIHLERKLNNVGISCGLLNITQSWKILSLLITGYTFDKYFKRY